MKPHLCLPSQFMNQALVYGVRRGETYLYIGFTTKFLGRFSGHHKVGIAFKLEPNDVIDVWFCESSYDAKNLEFQLIKEHKPIHNGRAVVPETQVKETSLISPELLALK